MVGTVKLEETGTVYRALGPDGPYQSICNGKIECVVDLIERSSTTQGMVCGKLEVGGPRLRSAGVTELMNEGPPDEARDVLVASLKDVGTEKKGIVWFTGRDGGSINSGPGRCGASKSEVNFLPLLCR